jgi:hypothetical protein
LSESDSRWRREEVVAELGQCGAAAGTLSMEMVATEPAGGLLLTMAAASTGRG